MSNFFNSTNQGTEMFFSLIKRFFTRQCYRQYLFDLGLFDKVQKQKLCMRCIDNIWSELQTVFLLSLEQVLVIQNFN